MHQSEIRQANAKGPESRSNENQAIEKPNVESNAIPKPVAEAKEQQQEEFKFERLNEADEKELGFDDQVRQHTTLFEDFELRKPFFVMNLEKLLQNFDCLKDDRIRNQFFIDNMQNY